MGQEEVFNILKKHKGQWFTVKQVYVLLKGLDITKDNVSNSLGRLRKKSMIKYKSDSERRRIFLYSSK